MKRGLIDIIRKNYCITFDGIDYKAPTGDGWSNYISHSLSYDDSILDQYLGTNVSKQNTGILQDENVKKFLQFIQREQESKFRTKHKNQNKSFSDLEVAIKLAESNNNKNNIIII